MRELRTKQDIVPGMEIPLELHVDRPGTYEIACAQLCGLGHSQMRSVLIVMAPAEYDQWKRQPRLKRSLGSRIFSVDHTVIARQYFFLSLFAVLVGTVLSLIMRFHLIYPMAQVAGGDVMAPEFYLSLLTLHGTIMVFFVLTLAPLNAFGNLVLPEQIGARGMAFPRLNRASFWISALSFVVLMLSFHAVGGGPLSGWTAYPPLSAVGAISGPGEGLGQTLWFFSIGLFCLGSLLSAINMIATVIDERGPGMTLMRMPVTCVELVPFGDSEPARIFGASRGGVSDPAGPSCGHRLLRAGRTARCRRSDPAGGWFSLAVAASLLVFRTSRGLYRDPARHGHRVASDLELLAQAAVRLSRDRLGFHLRLRFSGCWSGGTICSSAVSIRTRRLLFPF